MAADRDLRVAVLGLGEAGGLISAGLAAAGATVIGYDPLVRLGRLTTPPGVREAADAADACRDADLVLSLNSAADALDALAQGLPGCRPGTLWADLNTASPQRKAEVATAAADTVEVVDVALMAPVPGSGLRTPMAASGPSAARFAALLTAYGAQVAIVEGPIGAAATRKLLRSVFYKGLAAAVVEALEGARAAGLEAWLAENIREELIRSDGSTLDRLVDGSRTHAVRRRHEMAAAAELLDHLDVPARVTRAAHDWLADLAAPAAPDDRVAAPDPPPPSR